MKHETDIFRTQILSLKPFSQKKLSSGVLYKPSLKVLLEITIGKVI